MKLNEVYSALRDVPGVSINMIATTLKSAEEPMVFGGRYYHIAQVLQAEGLLAATKGRDENGVFKQTPAGQRISRVLPPAEKLYGFRVPRSPVKIDLNPVAAATVVATTAAAALTAVKQSTPNGVAELVFALKLKGSKLEAIERAIVTEAIARAKGNKSAAARMLGMDRKAFGRRLRRATSRR